MSEVIFQNVKPKRSAGERGAETLNAFNLFVEGLEASQKKLFSSWFESLRETHPRIVRRTVFFIMQYVRNVNISAPSTAEELEKLEDGVAAYVESLGLESKSPRRFLKTIVHVLKDGHSPKAARILGPKAVSTSRKRTPKAPQESGLKTAAKKPKVVKLKVPARVPDNPASEEGGEVVAFPTAAEAPAPIGEPITQPHKDEVTAPPQLPTAEAETTPREDVKDEEPALQEDSPEDAGISQQAVQKDFETAKEVLAPPTHAEITPPAEPSPIRPALKRPAHISEADWNSPTLRMMFIQNQPRSAYGKHRRPGPK